MDYKSLQKERPTSIALLVLATPLQHGAESTRAFGPSAAETTIGRQWYPDCHWYRSVSYTSTGRWPLIPLIQMPPMLVAVGKSPNSDSKAFSESLKFWSRILVPAFPV